MKSMENRLSSIGIYTAAITLAGTLTIVILGQFGRISPVLDVFSHFSSHALAMGLCALIALLIGRHHLGVLALGAVLTLAGHSALGYSGYLEDQTIGIGGARASTPVSDHNRSLKIISLNSWHSNRTPEEIVSYLKREKADVVILIEFGPTKIKLLKRLKRDYPHQIECATRWHCSLALLSRLPFTAAKAIPHTSTAPAIIWAQVKPQGSFTRPITVVGTHIYRPSSRPRLHVLQLLQLAKFVNQLQDPYVVAGDFNSTPWSQSYRSFLHATNLQPEGRMLPSWPVWPLPLPQLAIDHLFASKELVVIKRGLGPKVGSDHLPIWALVQARH